MAPKAIGHMFGPGYWFQGNIFTNPSDQTVLVDTGVLPGRAAYLIGVMLACSATGGCIYDIQHRNAANSANIHAQRRRPGQGNDDWNSSNKLLFDNDGERIRLLLQGAVTGEIQASIWIQEVVD